MSKMFLFPTPQGMRRMETWNIFTGCRHECVYCWSRPLALGRLKNRAKYAHGFLPAFHPEELKKKFRAGSFVFISSMGDISFALPDEVLAILEVVRRFPDTSFLFCTKNPACYLRWESVLAGLPPNLYMGATIETNRVYDVSWAPSPFYRYRSMGVVEHPRKFVSVEPVMDFDLDIIVSWLKTIAPEIVEVGADNHGHSLPEPGPDKVRGLLEELRKFVPVVVEKEGLERLKYENS